MGQTDILKSTEFDGRGDRRQTRYPFLGMGKVTANSMDPGGYVARAQGQDIFSQQSQAPIFARHLSALYNTTDSSLQITSRHSKFKAGVTGKSKSRDPSSRICFTTL